MRNSFSVRLLLSVCISSLLLSERIHFSIQDYIGRRKEKALQDRARPSHFVARFTEDIFLLHKYLIDWDTIKVAAGIIPAVFLFHQFDKKIQTTFYDVSCHKNVNQLPHWMREFARCITGPTTAILALHGFLSASDDLRFTSEVMIAGVPFLIFMNQLVKKMNFEICYRPWHESFSCTERSLGGFPSGHVSHVTYLAVLYGMRHGYQFALPLGFLSLFVGATFLSCNRHYLSQLIAGVGVGAIYGLAASKVVDYRLQHDRDIDLQLTYENGAPAFSLTYRF